MKVTTIILAHNEEAIIERAINSVKSISDRILIIDNQSTDTTAQKASAIGAEVISHPLINDFSQQRNWAMEQSQNPWILFVDADEVVSPELAKEIEQLGLAKIKTVSMFYIRRVDYWMGKRLTYGELHHASSTGFGRLIQKGTGAWQGTVHETWRVKTGIQENLIHELKHYPHPTVKEFLDDVNFYSTVRAKELFAAKIPVSVLEICAYPLVKFIVSYFFLLGFLDGAPGFIYSFMMSFHSFLVRSKLYQYYHLTLTEE